MDQNANAACKRILLIGGFTGSFEPARSILRALPRELPATIFIVVHLGAGQARPDLLFQGHSSLKVSVAEDGTRFLPGEVYVAPQAATWRSRATSCACIMVRGRTARARQ